MTRYDPRTWFSNDKKKQVQQTPAPQPQAGAAPRDQYASTPKNQTFGNFVVDSIGKVSKLDNYVKQYTTDGTPVVPFSNFQSMIANKPEDIHPDELISHLDQNYHVDGLEEFKNAYKKIGVVPGVNNGGPTQGQYGVDSKTLDQMPIGGVPSAPGADNATPTQDGQGDKYISKDFFKQSVELAAKQQGKSPAEIAPVLLQKAMEAGYTIEGLNDQNKELAPADGVGTSVRRTPAQVGADETTLMKTLDWTNIVGKGAQGLDSLAQLIPTFDVSSGRDKAVDERVASLSPEEKQKLTDQFNGSSFDKWLYGDVNTYIREKQKNFGDIALGDFKSLPNELVNAPGSAAKLATATARGITNPYDTLRGLAQLVTTPAGKEYIMNRYGSLNAFQHSMEMDPVGVASDILTVVGGGASLTSKVAKVAGATETAAKIGEFGSKALGVSNLGVDTAIGKGFSALDKATEGSKVANMAVKGAKIATEPVATAWNALKSVKNSALAEKIIGSQWKTTRAQKRDMANINGMTPEKFALENDLVGKTLGDTADNAQEFKVKNIDDKLASMKDWGSTPVIPQVRRMARVIKDKIDEAMVKYSLNPDVKTFAEMTPEDLKTVDPAQLKIRNTLEKLQNQDHISFTQMEAIKELYDHYNPDNIKWDINGKPENTVDNEASVSQRNVVQNYIEKSGTERGVDIKTMNDNIRAAHVLQNSALQAEGRIANHNLIGLGDTQIAAIGAILSGGPAALGSLLVKKGLFENEGFRANLAKSLYKKNAKDSPVSPVIDTPPKSRVDRISDTLHSNSDNSMEVKTFYHGTNENFESFDTSKIGSQTDDGLWGHGFYFTPDKEAAKNVIRGGNAKYIKEVKIDTSKLLDLSKFDSVGALADYLDMSESALKQESNGLVRPILSQTRQFTSHVEDKGFIGVRKNTGGKGDEVVVFNPKDIKISK